jgi:hypothetical protein
MNTITGNKQKRSKYSVRLSIAANFIAAYVELPNDFREFFERFLALQVYTEGDMEMQPYLTPYLQRYLPASARSGDSTRPCATDEEPSFYVYEAWFDWAQVIKGSALNHYERREAVRAMLGALIRQKDRRRLGDFELHEAAKETLGWTRLDAKHLAQLRRCGFSTTAEFEAWTEKQLARAEEEGLRSRLQTRPA